MKKIITLLSIGFLLAFTGCTKQGIKNKALVMSVEAFDSEAQTAGKENFIDADQQKIFAEFIKKHTQIDVDNVETQGDSEATARLLIKTFSKSIYPELKTISGKDWAAKVSENMETKKYNLKLKKVDGVWKIVERAEAP